MDHHTTKEFYAKSHSLLPKALAMYRSTYRSATAQSTNSILNAPTATFLASRDSFVTFVISSHQKNYWGIHSASRPQAAGLLETLKPVKTSWESEHPSMLGEDFRMVIFVGQYAIGFAMYQEI